MTHTIEVRGLRVVAVCGVLDEERARAQPLRLDLDVELDMREAAGRDELEATVNYAALCDVAVATLVAARPRLLEAACDQVAHALLDADDRVLAVSVTVAKLRPPVALDVETVGVRRRIAR